jgi:hypothetical protein
METLVPKKKLVIKLKAKTMMTDSVSDPIESKDVITSKNVIESPDPPAKHVCVKVNNLRKLGYTDLEQWINDPNNVYVGRHGRIFIHTGNEKKIYHYNSKWGNPYKVQKYSLTDALKLYEEYLVSSPLINNIRELKHKNLGCFCDQNSQCHAKILAKLANNL